MKLHRLGRHTYVLIHVVLVNEALLWLFGYSMNIFSSNKTKNLRTFAKLGIARALTEALQAGIGSNTLVSASIAVNSIVVNVSILVQITLS